MIESVVMRSSLPPLLVCLHFLGGSQREWTLVIERMEGLARCLPLDLPGFGDEAAMCGLDVSAMADVVADAIEGKTAGGWLIAGHSMGAKVALALARRAESGEQRLADIRGIVLIAGSPPSPEPMDEAKRADMIVSIAGDRLTREAFARRFIAENVGAPLDSDLETQAVDDVLRSNPGAWRAWLQNGSREDWCQRIGVLRTPALILSGAADGPLGPQGQEALMAPHFAQFKHIVLDGAGHLLPMERPEQVAAEIAAMIANPPAPRAESPKIDPAYRAFIASDRVNGRLRNALRERAEPDDPAYNPQVLDAIELAILRAVCGRVLPQDVPMIDIAARIDARLASGAGDGWRFAELPEDAAAYRSALRCLDHAARQTEGGPFLTRDAAVQDALLKRVEDAGLECDCGPLGAKALAMWFEDLRSDVVRLYLAHPATLGRLGFSGIGAGGDNDASINGFDAIGINERETWEPAPSGAR